MLKPSKRHFLRYDAQTYEEKGFIDLCGIPLKMHNDTTKDQRFAKEPFLAGNSESYYTKRRCH